MRSSSSPNHSRRAPTRANDGSSPPNGPPIEGALTITVEQDSEVSASEDGADEGDQQASDGGGEQSEEPAPSSEEGQADEGSETVAEDEADESGSGTLPLLLSVIGVAVVGAAVAAFFVLRRKQ